MSDATWKTDDLNYIASDIKFGILQKPQLSDWECHLAPGSFGPVLRPLEGNVPNAFHRFMQRVCFGFRWQKRGSN